MPETRIICIGSNVRDAILGQIKNRDVSAHLQTIPECKLPDDIQLDLHKRSRGERREKGPKRPPSAYNMHISKCMKSKNIKGFANAAPQMKKCAHEWREQRNAGG